jgi:hypothetical protein
LGSAISSLARPYAVHQHSGERDCAESLQHLARRAVTLGYLASTGFSIGRTRQGIAFQSAAELNLYRQQDRFRPEVHGQLLVHGFDIPSDYTEFYAASRDAPPLR